jgi:4-diphosphocytidyl-2-C-methyl-D-erythritol kinase
MEQIRTRKNALSILAPAKINLSLLIAGKRPDGFHEIETLMAKVNWYDEILIQPGREAGIELICEGPCRAPAGADNLVYQAGKLLLDRCRMNADLRITLRKNIPAGTGLGSASSDAAATLMGLNHYLQLNLDEQHLFALAARLGSDVSFFLNGPLAFCTGKGEKIKKLNRNFNFLALLILSDISVSTKMVYKNYAHNPALYESLSARINSYVEENKIDLVVDMCVNMLQESCFDLNKSLAELRETVKSLGIGPCCLSGSGSVMFCIIESGDERKAIRYKRKIKQRTGCESIIVRNNNW